MKKILVYVFLFIFFTYGGTISFSDATVDVKGEKLIGLGNPMLCGDIDNDNKNDVIFIKGGQISDESGFVVYSYAKRTILIEYVGFVGKDRIVFEDLDGDGDNEIILDNKIYDYASEGVIKK